MQTMASEVDPQSGQVKAPRITSWLWISLENSNVEAAAASEAIRRAQACRARAQYNNWDVCICHAVTAAVRTWPAEYQAIASRNPSSSE